LPHPVVRCKFRDNRNRFENHSFRNFFEGYSLGKKSENQAIFFRFRLSRNSRPTNALDRCKTFSGHRVAENSLSGGSLVSNCNQEKTPKPTEQVSNRYRNERNEGEELVDVTAFVVTSRLSASERKSVGFCDLYSWAVGSCLPYIGRCMHAYPVWPVLEKRSAATECMTDLFMRIDGLSSCEKADQRDFGEFRCRSTALFEL
jgi:hypothetical protein